MCELIDIAPMAAVDLLDMLTTAPKADELGGPGGGGAPVEEEMSLLFFGDMFKGKGSFRLGRLLANYHLFTYLEPIPPPTLLLTLRIFNQCYHNAA